MMCNRHSYWYFLATSFPHFLFKIQLKITAPMCPVAETTFSFLMNPKHGLKPRATAERSTLTWPPSTTSRTCIGSWKRWRFTPTKTFGLGCMKTLLPGGGLCQVTMERGKLSSGTGVLGNPIWRGPPRTVQAYNTRENGETCNVTHLTSSYALMVIWRKIFCTHQHVFKANALLFQERVGFCCVLAHRDSFCVHRQNRCTQKQDSRGNSYELGRRSRLLQETPHRPAQCEKPGGEPGSPEHGAGRKAGLDRPLSRLLEVVGRELLLVQILLSGTTPFRRGSQLRSCFRQEMERQVLRHQIYVSLLQ